MDAEGIEKIIALTLSNEVNEDDSFAVVQDRTSIISLEQFKQHPSRFKLNFNTNILSEFCRYIQDNSETQKPVIFINQDELSAEAIFDFGTVEKPSWQEHIAKLSLNKKPAIVALESLDKVKLTQTALADFIQDWLENITFYNSSNALIPTSEAIYAIQNIVVDSNKKAISSVMNMSAEAGSMEAVDIASKDGELPAYFYLSAAPFEGFLETKYRCILRAHKDGSIILSYRIMSLESIENSHAEQFKDLILDSTSTDLKVFIGTV